MLSVSISSTLACAIEQQRAFSQIRSNSRSRCNGVRTFESARPRMRLVSSRMTAAATTGPASGPRPASSTPAIRPSGSQASLVWRGLAFDDLLDGIGAKLRCVAPQLEVQRAEFLLHGRHSVRTGEPLQEGG